MNYQGSFKTTKFALLNDPVTHNSCCNRKMIIFVIFIIALFAVSFGYFFRQIFIINTTRNEMSKTNTAVSSKVYLMHSYNLEDNLFWKKFWFSSKDKTNHGVESICEAEEKLFPVARLIYDRSSNVYNLIIKDVSVHYEQIINSYDLKNLKLIFTNYRKQLLSIKRSEDFLLFLESLKSIKIKFHVSRVREKKINLKIEHFDEIFELTDDLYDWYTYLDWLENYLSLYGQQKNREKYRFFVTEGNFVEFMNITQESSPPLGRFFITEKKIKEINCLKSDFVKNTMKETSGSCVIFRNRNVLISEVNDQIKLLNKSTFDCLYIFASRTIYLDEDLVLPGINVGIIAPYWVFLKNVKINLSGLKGDEHKDATSTYKMLAKPGNPGQNSGDFLGAGNIDDNHLTVLTNGGKGGKGQNGANGRRGLNNSRPSPPIKTPSCMSKVGGFTNRFGQIITHYRIFSEYGCGGPGMDGGAGGKGGKGGRSILVSRSGVKVVKGANGGSGLPGKGGRGGVGGQNGCFYEALDINNEIAHQITKIKCPGNNILPSGTSGRDNYIKHVEKPLSVKVNLPISHALHHFLKFSSEYFINNSDSITVSFINQISLNKFICDVTDSTDFKQDFDVIEKVDIIEFYEIFINKVDKCLKFKEKDNSFLKYLKALALGKMLILKGNHNIVPIDFKTCLNNLSQNIKIINESESLGYSLPSSYLNKILQEKLSKIQKNLNAMKIKLKNVNVNLTKIIEHCENQQNLNYCHRNLAPTYLHRKMTSVVFIIIDIVISVVNLKLNEDLSNEIIDDLKKFNSTKFLLQSENLKLNLNEFKEEFEIFYMMDDFVVNVSQKEKSLKKNLENFSYSYLNEEQYKILRVVFDVLDALDAMREDKNLEDLKDELNLFRTLQYYLQRKELEDFFLNSLKELKFDTENNDLRKRLLEVMIGIQSRLDLEAVILKRYSSNRVNWDIIESHGASHQTNILKLPEKTIPLCKNLIEAIFDKNSALGDFYFWHNSEIKNELSSLFRGDKITLRSNLVNRHVLDKNFLRFKNFKMEFECDSNFFPEILNNFAIEVTHSGFSYYNWRGNTFTILSEEVTFVFGLKVRINEKSEVYNEAYNMLLNNEFTLSPYTTWTVRLIPLTNYANYNELAELVNLVNIRLTGTGIFLLD